MANIDVFFAGIGIEVDAIPLSNAHMGFAEQGAFYSVSLCIGIRKAECMLFSVCALCGGTAFCLGILESLGAKVSRLHSFPHGALKFFQYLADARQQDMALRHIPELVFRYSAEKQMRQSAVRILQQFLPRVGRFVEPGFDALLVVGDVLFPANKPDLAFFLGNGGSSFIEAVTRQRDIGRNKTGIPGKRKRGDIPEGCQCQTFAWFFVDDVFFKNCHSRISAKLLYIGRIGKAFEQQLTQCLFNASGRINFF